MLAVALISLLGPLLCSYSYDQQNLDRVFQSPDTTHLFGTDNLGRDLFARTTYGGRISLAVGLLATLVSLVIGVTYGMLAGYCGGRLDAWMMRLVDVLYSLPFIIFVILLMVLFGRNFLLLFLAIGAVEWLTMARITRAQTINLKNAEFIEAARALGYSHLRILFHHLLPNLIGPIIILRYAYGARGHAAGICLKLSRTGRTGTNEFLGKFDQGRSGKDGCRPLVALFPRYVFLPHSFCPEFFRGWIKGCIGPQILKGLILPWVSLLSAT